MSSATLSNHSLTRGAGISLLQPVVQYFVKFDVVLIIISITGVKNNNIHKDWRCLSSSSADSCRLHVAPWAYMSLAWLLALMILGTCTTCLDMASNHSTETSLHQKLPGSEPVQLQQRGSSPPRFFMMPAATEQLTRAIRHLEDIFELCVRFNRTCVLPRIGGGQIAMPGHVDFQDLYDLGSLPRELSVVDWGTFARHVKERSNLKFLFCVIGRSLHHADVSAITRFKRIVRFLTVNATVAHDPNCITERSSLPNWWHDEASMKHNKEKMDLALKASTHDVVAFFHYDYHTPLGDPATLMALGYTGLEYSPALFNAIDSMVANYGGRYIAVQWRTEKNPGEPIVKNFTKCALSAVQHVQNISHALNISHVYLASDVGRDGLPWSNSISYAGLPAVQSAMSILHGAFPNMLSWEDIPAPQGTIDFDIAVVGVLDKIAAFRSSYFLVGPVECGKSHWSSYTRSIIGWRRKHRQQNSSSGLLNDGDKWTVLD